LSSISELSYSDNKLEGKNGPESYYTTRGKLPLPKTNSLIYLIIMVMVRGCMLLFELATRMD